MCAARCGSRKKSTRSPVQILLRSDASKKGTDRNKGLLFNITTALDLA